jgi:hypothetical protein
MSSTKNKNIITLQSTTSTQIYLNSEYADIYMNGTMKSSVVFFFKNPIQINKNSIEMRLSVVNAQIPVSWYLINSNNNMITITISGVSTTYYFKQGNYNVNSFITEWNNSIGTGWTLTFDSITNKINFSYSTNFSFKDSINSIFPIMGFQKGIIYNSVSNNLILPFCINFAGITRLQMKSSIFNLRNVDSFNKDINRTIAVIPVNNIGSGYILYHNITQYRNIFKTYEIFSIDIEFRDDARNFIDFNNINWSCTLQIDVLSESIENLDNLEDVYNNQAQELF